MNRSIPCILLVLLSFQSVADECSPRVDSYIKGILLPVEQEQYVSQDKVDWAREEVERVNALRRQMPDCKVTMRISLFTQTDRAVEKANRQIAELKKLQAQSVRKKDGGKPKLYDRRY